LTINPETGQIDGGASFLGSFDQGQLLSLPIPRSITNVTNIVGGRYNAFTCVTFKGEGFTLGAPTEFGVWSDDAPVRDTTTVPPKPPGETINSRPRFAPRTKTHHDLKIIIIIGHEVGALLTFPPAPGGGKTTILARVGVSLISRSQACSNANAEIPDFDFEKVHNVNRAQWNELLGRVQVDTTGVTREIVQLFYSSVGIIFLFFCCLVKEFYLLTWCWYLQLYRTHISPADCAFRRYYSKQMLSFSCL